MLAEARSIQVIRKRPRTGSLPFPKGCLSERTLASTATRRLSFSRLGLEMAASPFGPIDLIESEVELELWTAFTGCGSTAPVQLKRTHPAKVAVKAG